MFNFRMAERGRELVGSHSSMLAHVRRATGAGGEGVGSARLTWAGLHTRSDDLMSAIRAVPQSSSLQEQDDRIARLGLCVQLLSR